MIRTFAIYESPRDAPGKFVTRGYTNEMPDREAMAVVDTLAEARAVVPMGTVRIPRMPLDHRTVVEVWI